MSSSKPIVIIAGNGTLPLEAARRLTDRGQAVHIVGISGEADPGIGSFDHDFLEWGKIGRLFKRLKEVDAQSILLAGGIVSRPDMDLRKMDWGAIRTLPEILGVLLAGDNTLLSGVIGIFEKRGFPVTSFPQVLPEMLVPEGTDTSKKPRKRDMSRLRLGRQVVRAMGKFDIGQGAVLVGDRVVALEGVEGTDAMLERVCELRRSGRLPAKIGGVLVKFAKPGQDHRADLPAIGPGTVEKVHKAGLNGIGVEARTTLIIDREHTLDKASKLGIFIHGLKGQRATSVARDGKPS